jgi:hypothetical protein
VLCPATWPRHGGPGQPKLQFLSSTMDAYLIDASNGFSRRGPHVFHLLLGGQRRPFRPGPTGIDPALRVTTRRVTIPMKGGGEFVQALPVRRFGTATVHDNRAALLRAPPYPQAASTAVTSSFSETKTGTVTSSPRMGLGCRSATSSASRYRSPGPPVRTRELPELLLNVRERAAALTAAGWDDRALGRPVTLEGLRIGALGVFAGAATGLAGATRFAGALPVSLFLTPVAAAAAGALLAALGALVPAAAFLVVERSDLSGAQIRRSCCSGVFVDQTAESIASVEPVWRVRTDEP